MVDFGGKLSLQSFVDRDGLLDDNFFEPMHGLWLHMQEAKNKIG